MPNGWEKEPQYSGGEVKWFEIICILAAWILIIVLIV